MELANSSDPFADDAGPDECHYDRNPFFAVQKALWMYVGYPVFVLGILGHAATALAVLSSPQLRAKPLSVYLLCMSASASLALCCGLLPNVVKHQTCYHISFGEASTPFGCRIMETAKYFGFHLYSLSEAAIAVERLIAVRWPLQCRRWCTLKANLVCVGVMIAILSPINAFTFHVHGYDAQGFCSVVDRKTFQSAWNYVNLALFAALPISLMLPCNATTLYVIASSAYDSRSVRKAKPITAMMLSLNALFLVTTVPMMIVEYRQSMPFEVQALIEVAWCVCRLFFYAGTAFTFLIYVVVAAKFRRALADVLHAGAATVQRALSAPNTECATADRSPA